MESELSPEQMREIGKTYFFQKDAQEEQRREGIRLLLHAHRAGDAEATYYIGRFVLDGILMLSDKDREEHGLELMCVAANAGCVQARAHLNWHCRGRYEKMLTTRPRVTTTGPLVDFEGKPIKINRSGLFTPIDAVLEYIDGENILTLSANVVFLYTEEIYGQSRFERAVYKGLLAWEGEYTVFGGQKLTVRVQLTAEDRSFDNLLITPISHDMGQQVQDLSTRFLTGESRERVTNIIEKRRSFASSGLRWTVHSRKLIFIQSDSPRFDDYEEITAVAKHEFGHALGLGDLYASRADGLPGVEKGTYGELDSYRITGRFYNLVMCDHHGPISNNDMEMVVLAFRENAMQLFQPMKLKGKISKALGKGN